MGPHTTARVRFETIDRAECEQRPGLLNTLLSKEIAGIHIRGVFTEDELARAVPALEERRPLANVEPFGAMLGMPLYESGQYPDRTPFFDSGDAARQLYAEAFGFAPHERLRDVLAPLASDIDIEFAREDGRVYNPGNVRWYDPGRGGLRAHAGNEFVTIHQADALAHLLSISPVWDHLSYFVILRNADEGGQLSVYDLLWVDRPAHLDEWNGMERDDSSFDHLPRLDHQPGPGDLTIFGGGWRYHRVDPIGGTIPRMTYGGFGNVSLDRRSLYLWC